MPIRIGSGALGKPRWQGLPPSPEQAAARWRRLQRRGKWLSVIRLAKASFTYAGGIDYLAWKINRMRAPRSRSGPGSAAGR